MSEDGRPARRNGMPITPWLLPDDPIPEERFQPGNADWAQTESWGAATGAEAFHAAPHTPAEPAAPAVARSATEVPPSPGGASPTRLPPAGSAGQGPPPGPSPDTWFAGEGTDDSDPHSLPPVDVSGYDDDPVQIPAWTHPERTGWKTRLPSPDLPSMVTLVVTVLASLLVFVAAVQYPRLP